MRKLTTYGLCVVGIGVALSGCAPMLDAIGLGMGASAGSAVAHGVTEANLPPDVIDGGLSLVENAAYAIPGVGALLGMGVGFLRRRRRWKTLNEAIGTTKDTADSPSKASSAGLGPITLNIYCDKAISHVDTENDTND